MRVTTALLIRNLISKLHPPSAATPRESQQLLRLLGSSLQKQLDDAHPVPQRPQDGGKDVDQIPIETARATSLHLDSILHHPLLEAHGLPTANGQQLTRDPVLAFEAALKGGTLDLVKLRRFVALYKTGLKQGQAKISHGIGPLIAAWFNAADLNMKVRFMTGDEQAISEVIPVMYEDGMEEAVWTWLSMLYKRPWLSTADRQPSVGRLLQAEDMFVSHMMRASVQRGAFQDAAQQYIQARDYRKVRDSNGASPLLTSWRRISSAVLARRGKHSIESNIFSQLLKCEPSIVAVPFVASNPACLIGSEHLQLYHPTQPSATSLYNALRNKQYLEAWTAWNKTATEGWRRRFLSTFLDAAQMSLDQNVPSQATFFLEFVQTQYPEYLPIKHVLQPSEWLAEAQRSVANSFPNRDVIDKSLAPRRRPVHAFAPAPG